MPTITEIQDPRLTYCKKYDIHCGCPNCEKAQNYCLKHKCPKTFCELCSGVLGEAEDIKESYLCKDASFLAVMAKLNNLKTKRIT